MHFVCAEILEAKKEKDKKKAAASSSAAPIEEKKEEFRDYASVDLIVSMF